MKRKFLIISILLMTLILCACKENSVSSTQGENTSVTSKVVEAFTTTPPPPIYTTGYSIDSYEDLSKHFSGYSKKSIIQTEKSLYTPIYKNFVDTLTTEKSIEFPVVDGETLRLRNKEGYDNITLFIDGLYSLPWIWYHTVYNDIRVIVCLTLPQLKVSISDDADYNCSELLKLMDPDAINVHNFQRSDAYENVYTKDIKLLDKTVSALVYDRADYDINWVSFYYHGYYVMVRTYQEEILPDGFWSTFTLSETVN